MRSYYNISRYLPKYKGRFNDQFPFFLKFIQKILVTFKHTQGPFIQIFEFFSTTQGATTVIQISVVRECSKENPNNFKIWSLST